MFLTSRKRPQSAHAPKGKNTIHTVSGLGLMFLCANVPVCVPEPDPTTWLAGPLTSSKHPQSDSQTNRSPQTLCVWWGNSGLFGLRTPHPVPGSPVPTLEESIFPRPSTLFKPSWKVVLWACWEMQTCSPRDSNHDCFTKDFTLHHQVNHSCNGL